MCTTTGRDGLGITTRSHFRYCCREKMPPGGENLFCSGRGAKITKDQRRTLPIGGAVGIMKNLAFPGGDAAIGVSW